MRYSFLFCIFFLIGGLQAQQTYTVEECENQFLKNNLLLVAEQFDVDASKAAIIQAKVWDNPYVSGEINLYNPNNQQYFDVGTAGQKAFAIQQLIYLSGKRSNEIALAKTNSAMAQLQFEDALRNLRASLKQSFYTIYFDSRKIDITSKQLSNLDSVIQAYNGQAMKGNVPLKDLVRLQSLYFSLKNDKTILVQNLTDEMQKLKVLTGQSTEIVPVISNLNKYFSAKKIETLSEDTLIKIAAENRPDYLLAIKNIESNEFNLRLQKAIARPDLTLGTAYDQRGGAFNNQINLTFGMPLPVWNKNKGNIKIAEIQVKQARTLENYALLQLKNEISATYKKWIEANNNYQFLTKSNTANFEQVYQGVMFNFKKQNITILEFTDFMESYNQSIQNFNEINKVLILSSEELNKALNKQVL
jgi:cobalt-zinc-cadmium efflux system outer membrane protein